MCQGRGEVPSPVTIRLLKNEDSELSGSLLAGCPGIAKNDGIHGTGRIQDSPLPSPVLFLLKRVSGDRRGESCIRPENGQIRILGQPPSAVSTMK